MENQYEVHPEIAKELAIAAMQPQQEQQPEQEQVVEQQVLDTQSSAQTAQQPEAKPEGIQAKNFRELRDQATKISRERDEYARRLQAYEQQQQAQQPSQPQYNVGDNDLVEGKHLSAYDQKIKNLEKQLQSYQQQSMISTAESRLLAEHPDFARVVTQENVEMLRIQHPELAVAIQSTSDVYSAGKSAYKLITRLGIQQEDTYMADRERVQKNANKPKPLASLSPQQGESPLSKVNAFNEPLTDELRKQLIKEMYEARKNH